MMGKVPLPWYTGDVNKNSQSNIKHHIHALMTTIFFSFIVL
jgi:hypothetical protein